MSLKANVQALAVATAAASASMRVARKVTMKAVAPNLHAQAAQPTASHTKSLQCCLGVWTVWSTPLAA
jgi:hypothetical protein